MSINTKMYPCRETDIKALHLNEYTMRSLLFSELIQQLYTVEYAALFAFPCFILLSFMAVCAGTMCLVEYQIQALAAPSCDCYPSEVIEKIHQLKNHIWEIFFKTLPSSLHSQSSSSLVYENFTSFVSLRAALILPTSRSGVSISLLVSAESASNSGCAGADMEFKTQQGSTGLTCTPLISV